MTLKEVRDQLRDRLLPIWDKVQESPSYISLKERFMSLPPVGQKLVIGSAVAFVLMMVLSIPWSYYSDSSDSIQSFKETRELTRQLFEAARSSNSGAFETMSASDLTQQIRMELQQEGIGDRQVASLDTMSPSDIRSIRLLPPPVHEEGVKLKLKELNVQQIVYLSSRLQSLSKAVKLVAMTITASHPNPHYFDVDMELATFGISMPTSHIVHRGGE